MLSFPWCSLPSPFGFRFASPSCKAFGLNLAEDEANKVAGLTVELVSLLKKFRMETDQGASTGAANHYLDQFKRYAKAPRDGGRSTQPGAAHSNLH